MHNWEENLRDSAGEGATRHIPTKNIYTYTFLKNILHK